MRTVIKVENLSKQYRLGEVGTGTISHDLNRWWHRIRGKEDPYLRIGESNDRSAKGISEYVWALQNINFEVQQGEVLGIIGKNGAGKSTMLKILSKVTAPTTGSIKAKGRIAALLEVGTGFHPELTGRENIYLNGTILGMTKREVTAKLDEIVDFAGVERYLDTPVKRYSSGMMVRLGFAVAAHLEPEILIVDEVLAVGDAEFQKKAVGKMKEVSREDGRTVLFVSHNMGSMQSLCDNGIILKHGALVAKDQINKIVQLYLQESIDETTSSWKYVVQNQFIQLTSFSIFSNNLKASTILSGDKVSLHLTICCLDSTFYDSLLSISILIFDDNGKVSNLWSEYSHVKYSISEEINFVCEIEKWPFRSGNYRFDVYTHIHQESIEWIEDVGRVYTESGDYFGNGIFTTQDQGNLFINHKFIQ